MRRLGYVLMAISLVAFAYTVSATAEDERSFTTGIAQNGQAARPWWHSDRVTTSGQHSTPAWGTRSDLPHTGR